VNKDQAKGRIIEMEGKVKEVVDTATSLTENNMRTKAASVTDASEGGPAILWQLLARPSNTVRPERRGAESKDLAVLRLRGSLQPRFSARLGARLIVVLMLATTLLSACGGGGGGGGGSATPTSRSWEKVDLPINLIESVAVSPLDRRIVYAGQTSAVNAEHAVWRSDDGGKSFHVVAKGVSFLAPSLTDPDRVFGTVTKPDSMEDFGSTQALYVSRDRGKNWEPAFKDGQGVLLWDDNPGRGIGQHPHQRDTIYALGRRPDTPDDGAVFKSTDGGASWVDVSPQGIALNWGEGYFVFDPLDVDTVFLSCRFDAPDGSAGLLLRTVDGGKSWQAADAGLITHRGKPPAMPGDSPRFDLYGGRSCTAQGKTGATPSPSRGGLGWGWGKCWIDGEHPIPLPASPLKGEEQFCRQRWLTVSSAPLRRSQSQATGFAGGI
jgi:hypothetical protein